MTAGHGVRRLLLLCTTTGYQARSFVQAAEKLGLDVVFGTDRCHVLEDPWQDGALPLRFEDPEDSARQIVEFARTTPLDAIVALGDRPTPTAARACQALGLPHHPAEAADACRDKYQSRERLRAAGLNVPRFLRFPAENEARPAAAAAAAGIGFPCVLKPLALSGSRGVIRADDEQEFMQAFARIQALLRSPEVRVMREATSDFIQAEAYVEGTEIAVEAVMEHGRLKVLALFDKPDPLTGPFFEETLYVTPSRLDSRRQAQIVRTLEKCAQGLGLWHGPVHAEMRLWGEEIWPLEVAARPIGGLCARALRFRIPLVENDISLEELVIRLALGMGLERVFREDCASGVMMIPIPREGYLEETQGMEEALDVSGVEEIRITAKAMQKLAPLPEGASYLGFIFCRAPTPEEVEASLREAHRRLQFVISPALPILK